MNGEIEDLEGPPGDEVSSRKGPANPEDPAPALERKQSASGKIPAPTQRKRKTKAGASASKRRKRFVL